MCVPSGEKATPSISESVVLRPWLVLLRGQGTHWRDVSSQIGWRDVASHSTSGVPGAHPPSRLYALFGVLPPLTRYLPDGSNAKLFTAPGTSPSKNSEPPPAWLLALATSTSETPLLTFTFQIMILPCSQVSPAQIPATVPNHDLAISSLSSPRPLRGSEKQSPSPPPAAT